MTENEAFIYQSIQDQVRMGFLSKKEIKRIILEEIEDNGFEDEMSKQWAKDLIKKEIQQVKTESLKWVQPTDTEKLIKSFGQLCGMNIIALHNAGYTTSDGEYEVVEIERALRKKKVFSDGFCFYHEQDLSRAISPDDSCLYLAFNKINNEDDAVSIDVGRKIMKVLKENGFEVEWDETATKKIMIPNFKWQYLYDKKNRDLLDYDKVIDLMLKLK